MRHVLGLFILLSLATPARADFGMSENTLNDLSLDATNQLLMRRVIGDPRQRPASRTARSTIAPAVGSGTSKVVRSLAAGYPAKDRAAAEAQFEQLLDGYHKIEQRFSIPRDDLAGAMAAIVVAGYMAYRNVDVADDAFAAVVAQLRPSVAADAQLARASAATRRELYERLAILGTFLAVAREGSKQQPPPWLAKAGAQFLSQFVGVDASRVVIDTKGLSIRPK